MRPLLLTTLTAALVAPLAIPTAASADRFLGKLEWSVFLFGDVQGFTDQQVDGSATFVYDTSAVSPVGSDELTSIPLRSFSMSPATIGATTFDLTNTAAHVEFVDGVLESVFVGDGLHGDGLRIKSVGGLDGNGQLFDDFVASWFAVNGTTQVGSFGVSAALVNGIVSYGGSTNTFTETLIPEPTALGLVALAGLCLSGRRVHEAG